MNFSIDFELVVSTHVKNISEIGSFPQVGVKIKNIWNHHLDLYCLIPRKWVKKKWPLYKFRDSRCFLFLPTPRTNVDVSVFQKHGRPRCPWKLERAHIICIGISLTFLESHEMIISKKNIHLILFKNQTTFNQPIKNEKPGNNLRYLHMMEYASTELHELLLVETKLKTTLTTRDSSVGTELNLGV